MQLGIFNCDNDDYYNVDNCYCYWDVDDDYDGLFPQVHVSDQGPGEEMQSPLTFGDDAMPRQATADNRQFLSEETLKKHTKMQERLYLQRISEDQPTLLNVKRIKVGCL